MPADGTEISLEKYYPAGSAGVYGRTWNNHKSNCNRVVIDSSFNDLSSVPYLNYWFYEMTNLEEVTGLQYLHGITSLEKTFSYCNAMKKIDLSNVDTSLITSLEESFAYCSQLTDLNLSGFTSSPVTTIASMCDGDSQLKTVNLFGFNTQGIQSVVGAFRKCPNLVHLDFTIKSCVLQGNYAFSNFLSYAQSMEDANFVGLTVTGDQTSSEPKNKPFYGNDSYKRATISNGIFDWSAGYSDNLDLTPGCHPSGDFYAYRNGEEVPGDTYGQITKARIDADSPTTFIKDKTATYNDYFFANGGTYASGDSVATSSGTVDQSATAPAQPTRPGYIFKGWKIADGTAVPTNANADYNFGKYGISTYNTFYADWEEGDPVTLSFDANGGTFASSGAATLTLTNQTPGDTLATVETPSKEGYEFGGWKDTSGATIVFPLTIPDVNATYTAIWTAEPGPTPPGPTPGPTPEPTPTPDVNPATDTTLLPVTGDTTRFLLIPALVCLGVAIEFAVLHVRRISSRYF